MQAEAIKYQPSVEGVVVTHEEEEQILKLIIGDGVPAGRRDGTAVGGRH